MRIPIDHMVEGGPPYRAEVSDIPKLLQYLVNQGVLQYVTGITVLRTIHNEDGSFSGGREEVDGWVLS